MFVVRFAHVDYADVVAVDEVDGWLVSLSVDVDTRALDDFLNGWVDEAGTGVVSAIANLKHLVAEMRFGRERTELKVIEVLVEFLACLDLEGMWVKSTAPSSAGTYVGFLREDALVVGCDIFEVDGTLPIGVPIAL